MSEKPAYKVTVSEFKRRLAAVCLTHGIPGVPRKRRTRHVLLKSVVLMLDPQSDYSEFQIDDVLRDWLSRIGRGLEIDRVSLRRYLIDEGYLIRDKGGRHYQVRQGHMTQLFEHAVNAIDPVAVIEEAVCQKGKRKQEFFERIHDPNSRKIKRTCGFAKWRP
jgi:hypothetical protein